MTQFNVSLLIRGDGADAEAALRKTSAEVGKLGTAAQTASRQTTVLGAAQRKAAGDAEVLASKNRLAAGSVGNLFAQFNDIGVMMASGQSPLQLGIQQGTQISQVLGPLGAGGAVRALGAALLSLISPINLITIGSIAAGAATFQWLTSSGEKAKTLEDRFAALGESVDRVRAISENYSATGLQSMIDKYGRVDAAILLLIQRQNELAQAEARSAANSVVDGIREEYSAALGNIDNYGVYLREAERAAQRDLGLTRDQAIALKDALNEARAAMSFEDKAAALATVSGLLRDSKIAGTELAAELLTAESNMRQLAASAPAASWMSAAISGVGALGAAIRARIGEALTLRGATAGAAGGPVYSGRGGDPRQFGANPGQSNTFGVQNFKIPSFGSGGSSGGGSGGGGGAARAEADAIGTLITRLRGEIDLARESDPIQREMLRLRKELTGATAEQRAEVETLIGTREREKAAMESLNYVSQQAGDALIDALMGASGAGERLIQTLSRAVLQAALLGQGPLAALFGGVGLFGAKPGGGGLLSGLLGAFIRPAATRSAAPAIAAAPPRFAKTSFGTAPGFAASGGGPDGMTRVQIDLGPGLVAQILDQARDQSIEITQTGLQTFDREALPARMAAINRDPRRKG